MLERKTTKNIKITKEYSSITSTIFLIDNGKSANNILDPSKGGIGTRLNIPKARLTITMVEVMKKKGVESTEPKENLIINPNIIAMRKFASTPAEATAISPHFLSLRLSGLYGTGFAQPNTNPAFESTKRVGSRIEPNISRCLMGFKVSLPACRAVGSPYLSAMKP